MKTPHKHAALIKAWADGAQIQHYSENVRDWIDCRVSPSWRNDRKYRIKPDTITVTIPRPTWVNIEDTHELKIAFATNDERNQAFHAWETIQK